MPVMFASFAGKLWITVALVSLATAAHQGWSANLFTMASDTFPKQAVGSVVGIGGFGGAVGGMLIASGTGAILQYTHSYLPIFLLAGVVYIVALAIIHLLLPRLEPAQLEVSR
jgi:ACS family hexuronate transporter-like MFS transporter